jgi:hypothetical protein
MDGYWWMTASENARLSYLLGYRDAAADWPTDLLLREVDSRLLRFYSTPGNRGTLLRLELATVSKEKQSSK